MIDCGTQMSLWRAVDGEGEGLDGIVMYGRPRCCKGKTDLKRR